MPAREVGEVRAEGVARERGPDSLSRTKSHQNATKAKEKKEKEKKDDERRSVTQPRSNATVTIILTQHTVQAGGRGIELNKWFYPDDERLDFFQP